MPAAYGSLANPVRLDPFQNIVEVGWSTVKHIKITLNLVGGDIVEVDGGDPCSPVTVSSFDEPSWRDTYYTGMSITPTHNADAVSLRGRNGWLDPAEGAVTVSGIPEKLFFVWEPWELIEGHLGWEIGALSGDSLDITPYRGTGTINLDIFGSPVIEGPSCRGASLGGSGNMAADFSLHAIVESRALSLSGITAIYKGKTFTQIAAYAVEGQTSNEPPFTTPIHVLLEREDATA